MPCLSCLQGMQTMQEMQEMQEMQKNWLRLIHFDNCDSSELYTGYMPNKQHK